MRDINKKKINRNRLLVIIGLILIVLSPVISGINLFYYPFENLLLSFFGIIFFDGLELASISFLCGVLIILYQLLLIVFLNKNSFEYEQFEDENTFSESENFTKNEFQEPFDNNEKIINKSFEQVDELVSQLDLVLKKSRHDVFNLMLDPNGINSPDDFQSAVESLELALSSLRAIKKQIIEMKKMHNFYDQ
tara:strand:- start:284 stop:859 length:576 start_codon:yes stop_codon:yes gene_type:complete